MRVVEPGSPAERLIARSRRLLLRPAETWETIEAEPATVDDLYRGWVIPLAAIPAVCRSIGVLAFGGIQIFGVRYRPGVLGVLLEALATYALTLGSISVLARIIDAFAPRFGGARNHTQAFKLAAYSGTAGWLGGVLLLLPTMGGLLQVLAGLYSLYLLYLGLPKLMRSDPDQTLGYFVLILAATLTLALLIGSLVSCVGALGGPIRID